MFQNNSKDFPYTNSTSKDLNLSNFCKREDYVNGGIFYMKATGAQVILMLG